jgi:hypothetical protein
MKKVRSCRTNGNSSDTSYGSSERGVSCFSCILWSLESDSMGYEPKNGCETYHRTNVNNLYFCFESYEYPLNFWCLWEYVKLLF